MAPGREFEFHLRVRANHADTGGVHDPKFNVADVLAIGVQLGSVGHEFQAARGSGGF